MELGIIIELDGDQHADQVEGDARRTRYLQGRGFTVLRFWNFEVTRQIDFVLERIWLAVEERRPSP